jgi:hypothetical protein
MLSSNNMVNVGLGLLLLSSVGQTITASSGRASLKVVARSSKRRRGKAVSNGSSNKYGTLISFAPAVAVVSPRGLFVVCLACLHILDLDLDLLLFTLSLDLNKYLELPVLVPVTGRI